MGIFGFMHQNDINQGVEQWKASADGVLIDVRTENEYRQGHIPGSLNIPLDKIDTITQAVPKKDTQIFAHCLSGARSGQAVRRIKELGYSDVTNIGGINGYRGEIEV